MIEKTLALRLFEYGYAERVNGRAVLSKATFQSGRGWEFEPIDLGPLPDDAVRIRRPTTPPPKVGESYIVSTKPSAEEVVYFQGRDEAMALADAVVGATLENEKRATGRYIEGAGRRSGKTFAEFLRISRVLDENPDNAIITSQAAWDMLARERPDLIPKPATGQRCPRCHRTTPPARCAVCVPEEK